MQTSTQGAKFRSFWVSTTPEAPCCLRIGYVDPTDSLRWGYDEREPISSLSSLMIIDIVIVIIISIINKCLLACFCSVQIPGIFLLLISQYASVFEEWGM